MNHSARTLQTELDYSVDANNLFQLIFGAETLHPIPLSMTSGIPTQKAPVGVSNITAKRRKFLTSPERRKTTEVLVRKGINKGTFSPNHSSTSPLPHDSQSTFATYSVSNIYGQERLLSEFYIDKEVLKGGILMERVANLEKYITALGLKNINLITRVNNKFVRESMDAKKSGLIIPSRYKKGIYKFLSRPERDTTLFSEGLVETMLLGFIYQGNMNEIGRVLHLRGFLNTFSSSTEVDDTEYLDAGLFDGQRYSENTGMYLQLDEDVKSLFTKHKIEVHEYTRDNQIISTKTSFVYSLRINLEGMLKIFLPIGVLSCNGNKKDTLKVKFSELYKMSGLSQLTLLNRTTVIDAKKEIIYVKLHTKSEIGFFGREYNTLSLLPRFDRAHIKSLLGYDMEAAMQSIFVRLLPELELPFANYYIKNKRLVRQKAYDIYVKLNPHLPTKTKEDKGLIMDRVKMELTAIFQGRPFGKADEFHIFLEDEYKIFTERDLITTAICQRHNDNSDEIRYAKVRTKDKAKSRSTSKLRRMFPKGYKVDFKELAEEIEVVDGRVNAANKLRKTFIFFYWTYYEKVIQDAMKTLMEEPISLHDAVYTQSGSLPLKSKVEKQIRLLTGFPMKLGKA